MQLLLVGLAFLCSTAHTTPLAQLALVAPTADWYEDGWFDPRPTGSLLNVSSPWLNLTPGFPADQCPSQRATPDRGEPLNLIISNRSSPDVLGENGFIAFSRSLGLWSAPLIAARGSS